jgi:general secretion pathway protein K
MDNIPAGDGDVSLKIADLSGRFNLNGVADSRGNRLPGYHRYTALCREVLQFDQPQCEELANSLVNWFNADRTVVTTDDNYYSGLQPPYNRKGAKLETVDELHLIRGYDTEIVRRLQPYLRVHGDMQINVNTASAELLYAWQFSAAEDNIEIIFDRQDIAALVDYRRQSTYRQLSDLANAEGIGERWSAAWLQGSVSVKGTLFQLLSRGRVNQGTRLAQAIVQKRDNRILSLRVE